MRDPGRIRVAVVDDHLAVRALLHDLIASAEDMVLVGQASDGLRGYELVRSTRPDVVLMDVRMPDMSGVEVTRRLTAEGCPSQVLLLTSEASASVVRAAVDAGAAGYLIKNGRAKAILEAVRGAGSGGSVWPGPPHSSVFPAAGEASFGRAGVHCYYGP